MVNREWFGEGGRYTEGCGKYFPLPFDAFVKGGAREATAFFKNQGKPVHCLSTRFEGVNYRVSLLMGFATNGSKRYTATYNPNVYNKFTNERDDESEEHATRRIDGRWLLSFCKALEHTKRTGGYRVQVAAHWHSNLRGPVAEDPAPRPNPVARLLAVWQPVQVDHEDGPYSDMQTAEKMVAEHMGITVLEFEFKETEVSEMKANIIVKKRNEAPFKQRLGDFLLKHGIADDMSPPPPPPIPGVFHLNATFSY